MTNREIENRLAEEIRQATPNVLAQVLQQCQTQKEECTDMANQMEVQVVNTSKRKKWIAGLASAAAAVVVVAGAGIFGYNYMAVDSVIGIDVNPSIELEINRQDKVLKAEALNQDANEILDGMELKGVDFDVAVNALIGSMLKNGYIDELKNSILISVDNDDAEKSAELENRLMEEISAILSSSQVDPALKAQTVSAESDELQKLSEQYQISVGKASLIQSICAQDSTKQFADLAKLSINDLYLIADSQKVNLDDTITQGNPSDKAYIDVEKAKSAAFAHAGVSASEVQLLKAELDFDDGVMVYEIEFVRGNAEYEYDIDAVTAKVLKVEKDGTDNSQQANSSNSSSENSQGGNNSTGNNSFISKEEAKNIALKAAGVNQAKNVKVSLDRDDREYNVEFMDGEFEYDYEIHAVSGKVLAADKERLDDDDRNSSSTGVIISEEEAKSIALKQAGISDPDWIEASFDGEDNKYDVEFAASGYEYDYEINAQNGKIMEYDRERL
ncbi:Peptidase propeptide and YPEB domain [uncultured Ruminococcus sp.]|nr:Peptidase propeptide and YPEB domain [uncultured Ruminococcus sp.]SCH82168.1 Peptidase propeptide and YPEB domain [uncultured Clostridium sp.]